MAHLAKEPTGNKEEQYTLAFGQMMGKAAMATQFGETKWPHV